MGKMKDLLYNIELWKKHLSENPTEIIEVVAVIAATHDLLTIEEEDEQENTTPESDPVSESTATEEDIPSGSDEGC